MADAIDSLFRQEALDAKRDEWLGSIELAMPFSYRVLAGTSLVASIVLVTFLVLGRYTHYEQVSGELVPSLGLLTTNAPSAGTVARSLVHEGDVVAKDQALIEISTELDSIELGKTRAAITDQLRTQRRRNVQALHDQDALTLQKQEGLKASIASFERQLQHIDTQISLQTQQANTADALWRKFQSVSAQGLISGLQIEQQKAVALAAQVECAALRRQRVDIEQQRGVQQDQLRQLPLTVAGVKQELEQKIADIDQTLAQNESQRAIVLRATAPGTISNLLVKDGQTVTAGQRLLSLVPQGSRLEAEFWLPSRAVGFITPGDRVVLRYRAFPYQKFGQQIGEVASVSHSASEATELSNLLGKKIDEPLYRVIVSLQQQSILAYGKPEVLRPGMVLDGDILLDSRRLIEWVFEPLYGLGR